MARTPSLPAPSALLDAYESIVQMEDASFNPVNPEKKEEDFRNYSSGPRFVRVKNFYTQNHKSQTYDFVLQQHQKLHEWRAGRMSIVDAFSFLDSVIDESDPDTNMSQLDHGLQTAEAIRAEFPDQDWFILTGLIHDLGKVLCKPIFDLEQWAIVGDTFPVGCAFSDKIVFPELFDANTDRLDPRYNSQHGVYEPAVGLMNVKFSFGHDEYLYQVLRKNNCTLPEEAYYMIRFHSFYSWHREGAYKHLEDEKDKEMLHWVHEFNRFDLYSKNAEKPNWENLKEYYLGLIDKYFPQRELIW